MKNRILILLSALTLTGILRADAGCSCEAMTTAPAASTETKTKGHPLKGVVIDVLADKSALLVKHEEIPGVMKAMTMLFQVDADTLAKARKGAGLTGIMQRDGDQWVLVDVVFASPTNP
jgi:Cu/Ag efflux protein CusF